MPQPLAVTLGEPAGIGPDIALAAWRRRGELDLPAFYLLGDPHFLARRAEGLGFDLPICITDSRAVSAASFADSLPVVDIGVAVTAAPGEPDASSAGAAIESIRCAVADVVHG